MTVSAETKIEEINKYIHDHDMAVALLKKDVDTIKGDIAEMKPIMHSNNETLIKISSYIKFMIFGIPLFFTILQIIVSVVLKYVGH